MIACGVAAESCTLLDGHGEIGPNHCLNVGETANCRTVVPLLATRSAIGIAVKRLRRASRSIVHFDVVGLRVEANDREDTFDHFWLCHGKRTIGVPSETSAEVVL